MDDDEGAVLKKQLVRALVRRGAAQAALGDLTAALADHEEALRCGRGALQIAWGLKVPLPLNSWG